MAKKKATHPKWRAVKVTEVQRSGSRIKIVLLTGEVAYGDIAK